MKPFPVLAAVLVTVLAGTFFILKRGGNPDFSDSRNVRVARAAEGISPIAVKPEARKETPASGLSASPAPLRQPTIEPDPVREPEFAEFREWLRRYDQTPPAGRAAL